MQTFGTVLGWEPTWAAVAPEQFPLLRLGQPGRLKVGRCEAPGRVWRGTQDGGVGDGHAAEDFRRPPAGVGSRQYPSVGARSCDGRLRGTGPKQLRTSPTAAPRSRPR